MGVKSIFGKIGSFFKQLFGEVYEHAIEPIVKEHGKDFAIGLVKQAGVAVLTAQTMTHNDGSKYSSDEKWEFALKLVGNWAAQEGKSIANHLLETIVQNQFARLVAPQKTAQPAQP